MFRTNEHNATAARQGREAARVPWLAVAPGVEALADATGVQWTLLAIDSNACRTSFCNPWHKRGPQLAPNLLQIEQIQIRFLLNGMSGIQKSSNQVREVAPTTAAIGG